MYNEKSNIAARTAFAAIVDARDRAFTLGLAQENQPGYWPQPQHGTFATYAAAAEKAQELNARLFHLTPEDAAVIVASSMFPSTSTSTRRARTATTAPTCSCTKALRATRPWIRPWSGSGPTGTRAARTTPRARTSHRKRL